jgi:hypothetical protein
VKWAGLEKAFNAALAGGRDMAIGNALISCWRDLGGKGKPTFKALHALPEE